MRQLSALLIFVCLAGSIKGQQGMDKELTLNEAIDIALKYNPEINTAKLEIESAKGRFWNGISLPEPELGISYEYIPLNNGLNNFGERSLEVSQSFEFPTNYFLKGSKYGLQEDIAQYELKKSEIAVVSRVKSAYYNILAKQEQLKIAEENLNIAEDFNKKADIRYNVGEGTNLERLTSKVHLTEAANNLEIAKNHLKTAYAELNHILGRGKLTDKVYILTDNLFINAPLPEKISLEELYNLSESENQEIKISELNLRESAVDKSLAWSSLLPGFNLAYYRQSLDGNNNFYGGSLGISVPLWFLFEHRGNIQEAAANENIAEWKLQSIRNEVFLRIRTAFNEYENNLRQVNVYRTDIIPQAEEIFRTASASYDAGEITYLEFLQARQTIMNANRSYVEVLINYYQSIFSMEEIVGSTLLK